MKYNIWSEYKKYQMVQMPTNPRILKITNKMMPVIQKANSPYEEKLIVERLSFSTFHAELIQPKNVVTENCLVYYHGGAFVMKAASYHKNLVRLYAYEANMSVLFVDYRLAPDDKYPVPVDDCYTAYQWALEHFTKGKIIVGGDSAGGALAQAVIHKAHDHHLRIADGCLLMYPVCNARMETGSMQEYVDTPLWNAKLNQEMWDMYATKEEREEVYCSPAEASDVSFFPPTYIEVAQYDCLHDEGVNLYQKLMEQGVNAELQETEGTIHGFDIEENSAYVKACVNHRVNYLKNICK